MVVLCPRLAITAVLGAGYVFSLPVLATEYPVQVKYEDWEEDEDSKAYIEDLITRTGGLGIGVGLILALILFPMFFLCYCRCCSCGSKSALCGLTPPQPTKIENLVNMVSLLVCLALVVLMAIMMGVTGGKAMDDVDATFEYALTGVDESADWICGGPLKQALWQEDNTQTAREIAAEYSPNECDENSVMGYVNGIQMRTNALLDASITFINDLTPLVDTSQEIVNDLQDVSDEVSYVTNLLTGSGGLIDDTNELLGIVNTLNDAQSSGVVMNLNIPSTENIPEIDQTDVDSFASAQTQVDNALVDVQSTLDELNTTIKQDLQVDTVNDIEKSRSDVMEEVDDLKGDVYDTLDDMRDTYTDIEDTQSDANGTRSTAIGILAGLCALFTPFVLLGALASVFRGRWAAGTETTTVALMRTSASCIYLLVFYLVVIAGISGFLHAFVDHTCSYMLKGNEKSDYKGIIQVNLGNETVDIGKSTVNIADTVVLLLQCPVGCALERGMSVGCTETNNLVQIFGIEQEFNYTAELADTLAKLQQAEADLNVTHSIDQARTYITSPEVEEAINLDLTQSWSFEEYSTSFEEMSSTIPASYDYVPSEQAQWQEAYGVAGAPNSVQLDAHHTIHDELTRGTTLVEEIEYGLDRVIVSQSLIQSNVTSITQKLDIIEQEVIRATDQVQTTITGINNLIDFIFYGASGAFRCGWMGTSYHNLVTVSLCDDLVTDWYQSIVWSALCCVVLYTVICILLFAARFIIPEENEGQKPQNIQNFGQSGLDAQPPVA